MPILENKERGANGKEVMCLRENKRKKLAMEGRVAGFTTAQAHLTSMGLGCNQKGNKGACAVYYQLHASRVLIRQDSATTTSLLPL